MMIAAMAAVLPLMGGTVLASTAKASEKGTTEQTIAELHAELGQRGPGGGQQRGPGGQQRGPGGQGGPGGQMMMRRMNPAVEVLSQQAVHKELKLTQEQVQQIGQLLEKFRPPMGPGSGGPGGGPGGPGGGGVGGPGQGGGEGQAGPRGGGQRRGGEEGGPMGQRGPRIEEEVKQILNEGQFHRFEQLVLQFEGPTAVMRPEIGEVLGLTDQQREQIREIMAEARPEGRRGGEFGQGGGQRGQGGQGGGVGQGGGQRGQGGEAGQGQRPTPPTPEEMEARRKELEAKLMSVLTADQKAKWQSMLGAPFTFEKPAVRQAPPQRRGGGGGGGGDA